MTVDRIRAICLKFPHATEQIQWADDLVFKVGGKMFAVIGLSAGEASQAAGGSSIAFKCTSEEFALLIEQEGIIPAPYLARAYWVKLEGAHTLRPAELASRLRQSYDLVFAGLPKKLRQTLA